MATGARFSSQQLCFTPSHEGLTPKIKVNLFVPGQLNGMSSFGTRLSNQQGVDLVLRVTHLGLGLGLGLAPDRPMVTLKLKLVLGLGLAPDRPMMTLKLKLNLFFSNLAQPLGLWVWTPGPKCGFKNYTGSMSVCTLNFNPLPPIHVEL